MDETRQERKRQVALGYRILAAQRWGDLGDGHISARDPEREDCFWLLRYGVSYHRATVADLVLVGPDGELADGDGYVDFPEDRGCRSRHARSEERRMRPKIRRPRRDSR